MFARQRAILRLIENEGGVVSRLRLVKLAFLLSRSPRAPRTGTYDFVPYKKGPFSFTMYHEMAALERDGWISASERDIRIIESPDIEFALLDNGFLTMIDDVTNRCRQLSTAALVDIVYAQHPWFTLNADAVQKRAAKRPSAPPAVYTVGYEGIMVDTLLNLLLQSGVVRLADVRCNPTARRYGFHKSTLSRLCGDLGIDYVHFSSLGVPSAWRASLSDRSSYDQLFERYRNEILPTHRTTVELVAKLITEKTTALMCMEADHNSCHRSHLGEAISRKTSLPVRELRQV